MNGAMRTLSHAFQNQDRGRAAIAEFSRKRSAVAKLRSHARAQHMRAGVIGAVIASGLLATGLYQAWSHGKIVTPLRTQTEIEAERQAARFGEVRIPISGNRCASYAFDNASGTYLRQSATPCVEELPPNPAPRAEGAVVDRAKSLSNAFKR